MWEQAIERRPGGRRGWGGEGGWGERGEGWRRRKREEAGERLLLSTWRGEGRGERSGGSGRTSSLGTRRVPGRGRKREKKRDNDDSKKGKNSNIKIIIIIIKIIMIQ